MRKKYSRKHMGIEELEKINGRKATLFELSIIAEMPEEAYAEITERLSLVLKYLEDGGADYAAGVLKEFLTR
jgi:hypothetical protein